ncbi:MAG: WG repeat-containing protein [Bacteroidia bacterium]|nr:WG repeat-containing protein [Bacteroidia bacterium]
MQICDTYFGKFILLILSLLFLYPCEAQELIPYRKGDKWGLADTSGKVVVKCEYDGISFPENGMIYVKLKNETGIIDASGKTILEPKYKSVGYFHDHLAFINEKGKWGYINPKGEEAIEPKYEQAGNFNQGIARAKWKGKWGFIDTKGKEEVKNEYESLLFINSDLYFGKKEGKWGAFNGFAKEILPPVYDSIGAQNGDFRLIQKDKKWGLFKHYGEIVLECEYNEISSFNETFLRLRQWDKYGLMHKKTQKVLPCEFTADALSEVAENADFYYWKNANTSRLTDFTKMAAPLGPFFAAKKENKWAIMDTMLNEVYPFQFDSVYVLGNHYTVKKFGKWGIYNPREKKFTIFCRFTELKPDTDGRIISRLQNDYGMIDTFGNMLVACIYEEVHSKGPDLFQVSMNGKYGLINSLGIPVTPLKYTEIEDYNQQYAFLQTGQKTGLFDYQNKKILIPAMFDAVTFWKNNMIVVREKEEYGIMNTSGKWVNHLQYSEVTEQYNGRLKVRKNNKIGWMDSTGRMFIPCKYDSAGNWFSGIVPVKYKGKWGAVDSLGRVTIPFEYNAVWHPLNDENPEEMPDSAEVRFRDRFPLQKVFWVKGGNHLWGLCGQDGKEIIKPGYDSIFTCRLNPDLYIVSSAARFGLVKNNEEILGTAYNELYETNNGFFIAQQGTRFALIASDGSPITPFKYQEIQYVENDKYLWVLYDDRPGIISFKGKEFFEKGEKSK